jgi:hypothetical protein
LDVEMAAFAQADDVSEELDALISKSLSDLPGRVCAPVDIDSWYHDQPVWHIVERSTPGEPYRAVQLAIVKDVGRLWLEVSADLARVMNGHLWVSRQLAAKNWARLSAEELAEDSLIELLVELWTTLPQSAVHDFGDPATTAIPLSAAIAKQQ